MRVLQLLPSLDVGGVERGVIDLCREMKKRGEYPVVISSGGDLVGELLKMGVPHYQLPIHKKSLFALALIPKICEIIRKERIEVVHGRSRVPAWLGWLAARKCHIPFVTTCHGYYSTHPLSRIMGWGKRVIVISRVIGRHMIDDFGVTPDRVCLIHRGVDLEQFPYRERENQVRDFKKKPFRIICVGRFSPIKGQLELLRAIHGLRQKFQWFELALVGAEGKGKSKYTQQLQEMTKQLGLESCVKFLGTRRDIAELLSQSDLLVLPTLVPEAFGRVLIEAGAVGTPVIATRTGGILDIIEEGENGWLVPPGDIAALTETIHEVITQPEKVERFTKKMREKVQKEFTLISMFEKTLNVYREVVRDKKILFIKLGALGDVILAIPSLRMIKKRFPQAHITLLVDKPLAPVISASPYIDHLALIERKRLNKLAYLFKLAHKLRREGFDISLDLQNSKWTHLLAFLAGIPERFGFQKGPFGFLLNRPDRAYQMPESPVKNQFRILSKLGIHEFDEALELWPDIESEHKMEQRINEFKVNPNQKLVGLVIGSSPTWPTKRWPMTHVEELCRKVIDAKHRIVLLGSAADKSLLNDFSLLPHPMILDMVGQTDLSELISLIRRLDVVVTGDTAALHVAAATQSKIVALFGPTDPKRHMPTVLSAVILQKSLSCQPCYSGECKNNEPLACMSKISVNEVFECVERHLNKMKSEIRMAEKAGTGI